LGEIAAIFGDNPNYAVFVGVADFESFEGLLME